MVSDIPAGDGKLVNLFLRCAHKVDADPAFHFDADPDPDPTFTLMPIQIRESASSGLKTLQGSTVSLYGSRMSLLDFIPAFDFDTDPDPASI